MCPQYCNNHSKQMILIRFLVRCPRLVEGAFLLSFCLFDRKILLLFAFDICENENKFLCHVDCSDST